MSEIEADDMDEIGAVESMDKLNSLRITSLDDDDIHDDEELQDDHDTDDDDDEESNESVVLGFVAKPKNSWSLLPQLFPSKAGGVPAWLDPVNLPSGRSCVCDICGEPLQFLLQIYAPIVEKDSTFHRTLFAFMCPSMTCLLRDQHEQWKRKSDKSSRSVKVFRGQLPRSNPFYSSEPPKHDGSDKACESGGLARCNWCGTWKGDKVCGKCRTVRYCSEKHQAIHWRTGHKTDCQRMCVSSQLSSSRLTNSHSETDIEKVSSKHLWPEFEIMHEYESEFDIEISHDNSYANAMVCKDRMDDSMKSLLANFEGDDDRKSWASFQGRLSKAPEQVLRYCRDVGSKPLWPMPSGLPSKEDIPKCSYCSGPMCYEFQILPQLLYYFGVKNDVDSLDWATIVVYTCEASCESSIAYKEEFAWVQLSVPSAVHQ
ncbi:programmed cell death protein 2 isoform X2 [Benincasa hispida]|uniref:programmed cell death protein 2 isoform X2 n=1 Tax=Benincasa hispida TaxID=102211 RepID=UPI001902C0FE|nr:programmed cell death protein 2 isoform X2 [Benincasa hispida]